MIIGVLVLFLLPAIGFFIMIPLLAVGILLVVVDSVMLTQKRIGIRKRPQTQPFSLPPSEPEPEKRCLKCGQVISQDDEICRACSERKKKMEEEAIEKPSTPLASIPSDHRTPFVMIAIILIVFLLVAGFAISIYIYVANPPPIHRIGPTTITVDILSTYDFTSPGYLEIDGTYYRDVSTSSYEMQTYEIDTRQFTQQKENYSITLTIVSMDVEKKATAHNVTEYVKFHLGGTSTYMDDLFEGTHWIKLIESH